MLAPSVKAQLQAQLMTRKKREFYLLNPHLWADEVLGLDVYELHMRTGAVWRGWNNHQIALMRDICDIGNPETRLIMAICNRAGSKTYCTAVSVCNLVYNIPRFKVGIVAGSLKQANDSYKYCKDIILHTEMKEMVEGDVRMSRTDFKGGGVIDILPGTLRGVQSGRYDMLIYDEACKIKSDVFDAAWGQVISAVNLKGVILTTPDDVLHKVKTYWDEPEKIQLVRFHWDAYQCSYIPNSNIELMRNIYDDTMFRIYVLGLWTSRSGSVFKYEDIQAALCSYSDLPPLDKIEHFYMGVDWGFAHPTAMSIWGMYGDIKKNTDRWFLYESEQWVGVEDDEIIHGYRDRQGEYHRGLLEYAMQYTAEVWSEQSAVSVFANRKLRRLLGKYGIILQTDSFSGKKYEMVSNLKGRVEKRKLHIPKEFKSNINQMINYHYKEVSGEVREEFEKKSDDHVDANIWAHWGQRPGLVGLKTIGAYEV